MLVVQSFAGFIPFLAANARPACLRTHVNAHALARGS